MACTAINASAIEYVPCPDSCAYITSESMFMLDAGANTTDFTRTIHYGLPTDLEREIYTRLLKGMLAIESTSFPEGTTGTVFVDKSSRRLPNRLHNPKSSVGWGF